jgi:hypothetical protein
MQPETNFIYNRVLSEALRGLNHLEEEFRLKSFIRMSLEKTLSLRKGKLSPAVYPFFSGNNPELAYSLSVICAYYHSAVELNTDVQNNAADNPLINCVGKAQASNIASQLTFTAINLIGRLRIEDSYKLELFNLFSGCGRVMCLGRFFDLDFTNKIASLENLSVNDILLSVERKAGYEISCYISCYAVATGINPEPFYRLGMYLGALSQVFSDYSEIWCQNGAVNALELKNNLAVFAAYKDPVYGAEIRLRLAGKNHADADLKILRRLMAKTQALEEFEKYFGFCRQNISKITAELPGLTLPEAVAGNLYDSCNTLVETLYRIRQYSFYRKIQG